MPAMRALVIGILAFSGCGDDGGNTGQPDAPGDRDAAPPDAAPGTPVRVTVRYDGMPVKDVAVFYQNADSTLVAKVLTDVDGVASAVLADGGFVTAVDAIPVVFGGLATHDLRTWSGVKAGDELRIEWGTSTADGITIGITAPSDPGAVDHVVGVSCTGPFFLNAPDGTHPKPYLEDAYLPMCAAMADVVIETRDDQGIPLKYAYQQNVMLTNGGRYDANVTYAPIPMSTWTWTNVTGTSVSGITSIESPRGYLMDVYDFADIMNGTGTMSWGLAPIPGARALTTSEVDQGEFTRHTWLDWGPASSLTYDLGSPLPTATTAPTYDFVARKVGWTASASTVTPDTTYLEMSIYRPNPEQSWSWAAVAAHTGSSITLPDLPAELDTYDLKTGDDPGTPSVAVLKSAGGYDAVRENAHTVGIDDVRVYGQTGTGRAQVSHYRQSQPKFRPYGVTWDPRGDRHASVRR